jgi:hypothetical protein
MSAAAAPAASAAVPSKEEVVRQAYLQKAEEWKAKLDTYAEKASQLFLHAISLSANDGASAAEAAAASASARSVLFYNEEDEGEWVEADAEEQARRTELIEAVLAHYEKKATKERNAALHWIFCRFHTDAELLEGDHAALKTVFGQYAYLAVAVLSMLHTYTVNPGPADLDKVRVTLDKHRERRQRLLRHLLELAHTNHALPILKGVTRSYEGAIEAEIEFALHWVWNWLLQNPTATPAEMETNLGAYAQLATPMASVLV